MRVIFLTFVLLSLIFAPQARAIYDPLSVANNKYGIHIADVNDVSEIGKLVNSGGGDWGYVTLVIPETDRNSQKWQGIFDELRRNHIIPLVRLATRIDGDNWTKPTPESIRDWPAFLSSLNWPTQNRYVILYNEPNHAKEWGNTLDPEGYAEILATLGQQLRATSPDFFILPAGLDVSATNSSQSMDAAIFLRRMFAANQKLVELIDGWTSHSYPNPGFAGSPTASGRGTLRSFEWELSYLKSLGINDKLPVFITETGWEHSQGLTSESQKPSPELIADYITLAAKNAWNDPRIVTITPFVYSYQGLPFDHFSWKKLAGGGFYPFYDSYTALPKPAGQPKQLLKYFLSASIIPESMVAGSVYTLTGTLTNSGQGIINPASDKLRLKSATDNFLALTENLPVLEPGHAKNIKLYLKTPDSAGDYLLKLSLFSAGQELLLEEKTVKIIPPPGLVIQAALGWKRPATRQSLTALVYDMNAALLHKFTDLVLENGQVRVLNLTNIIPGKRYRVVLLISGYLPRQTIVELGESTTTVVLPRFLPLDPDLDGALTMKDLWLITKNKPWSWLREML